MKDNITKKSLENTHKARQQIIDLTPISTAEWKQEFTAAEEEPAAQHKPQDDSEITTN